MPSHIEAEIATNSGAAAIAMDARNELGEIEAELKRELRMTTSLANAIRCEIEHVQGVRNCMCDVIARAAAENAALIAGEQIAV